MSGTQKMCAPKNGPIRFSQWYITFFSRDGPFGLGGGGVQWGGYPPPPAVYGHSNTSLPPPPHPPNVMPKYRGRDQGLAHKEHGNDLAASSRGSKLSRPAEGLGPSNSLGVGTSVVPLQSCGRAVRGAVRGPCHRPVPPAMPPGRTHGAPSPKGRGPRPARRCSQAGRDHQRPIGGGGGVVWRGGGGSSVLLYSAGLVLQEKGFVNANRHERSRGRSPLHGQDMGKTRSHRNGTEQRRAVGGGWRLVVLGGCP